MVSPLALIIVSLLASIAGIAIGWYWKQRTDGTWKADFQTVEKENKTLHKLAKKGEKDTNRLKKQLEAAKTKNGSLEEKYSAQVIELQTQLDTLTATNIADTESIRTFKVSNQQLKNDLERLQKAHTKLEIKYKEDLANLKEWSRDKEKFNRAFKDVKADLKVAQEKIARLNIINDKKTKELEENSAFVSKLRAIKARNAKFSADLKYWEKKHYDTHHELAAIQTTIEAFKTRNEELELINVTAIQAQEQMVKKVQEFKTRFVDMNNKYHELLNAQKN